MATNIYNKESTFNIDSLSVLDLIMKFNTVTYIEMEIIFNCDMEQIINKYPVVFSLVNPNNTSIVYAQITPAGSNFNIIKNTIPVNGGLTTYNQQLSYFNLRYTDNNHFSNGNASFISNSPAETSHFQLQITIDGNSKLYNIKDFAQTKLAPMPIQPNTFTYLQTFNLSLRNYYFQNTDVVNLKINNTNSVSMPVHTINNYSNIITSVRANTATDFNRNPTAKCTFSGTNSYALVKTYTITSASTLSTYWIDKGGFVKNINPTGQSSTIFYFSEVGCSKLFNTTLKNVSSVTDTVYLEFPLFRGMSSTGLVLSSVSITATPNKVSFATAPVITALGLGKFKLELSYSPTGEPASTTATYSATVSINFTHPIAGNMSVSANGFIYTNSTG